MDPEMAVMVVVCVLDTVLPIAIPLLPIFATSSFEDFQVTALVASKEVPSLRTAVALNAWVCPPRMDDELGATMMDSTLFRVTMTVVVPVVFNFSAVIVAVPAETPFRSPELETVATVRSDEDQVTEVKSLDEPSSYPPTAVNWTLCPTETELLEGSMATDVSFGSTQKSPQEHRVLTKAQSSTNAEMRAAWLWTCLG
jgi:hypothetical protein